MRGARGRWWGGGWRDGIRGGVGWGGVCWVAGAREMGGKRGRIEIGIWVGRRGGWTVEVGGGRGAADATGGSGYVSCCVHGPRVILAQVGRCGGERWGGMGSGDPRRRARWLGGWCLETMDALKRFMRGFLSSRDRIRYPWTVCVVHG